MKKLLITSTAAVMLSMATGVFAAETSKSATAVNGSATEVLGHCRPTGSISHL